MLKHTLILYATIGTTLAFAGVSSIKDSAPRAKLIDDSISSSVSDPGFVSNELGGTWKADIDLSQATGQLNNVTLGTSVNGAPSLDLTNTRGTNSEISDIDTGGSSEWTELFSGSTTGSISIPSGVANLYVTTSTGSTHFIPVVSAPYNFASSGNATARWTGSAITGGTYEYTPPPYCWESRNSTFCTEYPTVRQSLSITKIMVQ
ncbi:hypothetical protein FIV04_25535 (plasmid) [Vibrio sp. THAF190c]|nr:hypothetical protein FIV04_25535 [Vibrio sp. THAF190c]